MLKLNRKIKQCGAVAALAVWITVAGCGSDDSSNNNTVPTTAAVVSPTTYPYTGTATPYGNGTGYQFSTPYNNTPGNYNFPVYYQGTPYQLVYAYNGNSWSYVSGAYGFSAPLVNYSYGDAYAYLNLGGLSLSFGGSYYSSSPFYAHQNRRRR